MKLSADSNGGLELRLKGLSTFRNEVVYIDLERNESYSRLVQIQSNFIRLKFQIIIL